MFSLWYIQWLLCLLYLVDNMSVIQDIIKRKKSLAKNTPCFHLGSTTDASALKQGCMYGLNWYSKICSKKNPMTVGNLCQGPFGNSLEKDNDKASNQEPPSKRQNLTIPEVNWVVIGANKMHHPHISCRNFSYKGALKCKRDSLQFSQGKLYLGIIWPNIFGCKSYF